MLRPAALAALLAISLALNIAVRRRDRGSDFAPATTSATSSLPRASVPASPSARGSAASLPAPASPFRANPGLWQQLCPTDDLRQLAANLYAAGFRFELAQIILDAFATERAARRVRALQPPVVRAYWMPSWNEIVDERSRREVSEIERTERQAARDALFSQPFRVDPADNAWRVTERPDLAPAQLARAEAIGSDYDRIQRDNLPSYGELLEEDRRVALAIEHSRQADLAAVLSPGELDAFAATQGRIGWELGRRFKAFEPSPAEKEAIVRAEREFAERFRPGYGWSDPTEPGELAGFNAGKAALADRLRTALGDARYDEYVLAQDYFYQNNARFADEHGIAHATLRDLWAIREKLATDRRALEAAASAGAPPTDAIRALQRDAEAKLARLLTPAQLAAYKAKAAWLGAPNPAWRL